MVEVYDEDLVGPILDLFDSGSAFEIPAAGQPGVEKLGHGGDSARLDPGSDRVRLRSAGC